MHLIAWTVCNAGIHNAPFASRAIIVKRVVRSGARFLKILKECHRRSHHSLHIHIVALYGCRAGRERAIVCAGGRSRYAHIDFGAYCLSRFSVDSEAAAPVALVCAHLEALCHTHIDFILLNV